MRTHKDLSGHARKTLQKVQAQTRDDDRPVRPVAIERLVASASSGHIVIIDKRALVAECMASCLTSMLAVKVASYTDLESWLADAGNAATSLVVFCNYTRPHNPNEEGEWQLLAQVMERVPTVILSDKEDVEQILAAIDSGARGFIPTTMSLDVVVEAIRLVRAGGVFVPANCLLAARRSSDATAPPTRAQRMFTVRQAAVVQALCKGKANKLIAHELNMRESTVKVHVRNIMKKLSAKNRTEVALMASGLSL